MKIFVFTYDRYATGSTSPMLEDEKIDHYLLCHSEEQKNNFIKAGIVNPDRLIATGNPKGLGYNRNAALDMMEENEWAVFMSDDMRFATELKNHDQYSNNYVPVDMTNQREWKIKFDYPILLKQFIKRAEELTQFCDSVKSYLGGFCGINNPPYRSKHYTFNTFADGRAWVIKKSHLRFDENVHSIDDYAWNALNLLAFGITVVNQWVLPDFARYTAGGYGSVDERMQQKIKECAYLVDNYPNYFAYKDKAGHPSKSHITLRPQPKPAWVAPELVAPHKFV